MKPVAVYIDEYATGLPVPRTIAGASCHAFGRGPLTIVARVVMFLAAALILLPSGSHAASVTATDMELLPKFCRYAKSQIGKYGNNPAETERYSRMLGPTFDHIHHYCFGMIQTNRATLFPVSAQQRAHLLNASIGEFDYVINRATPDFLLLPEILTKKGENLIRLRRYQEAVPPLLRAIDVKPDYWPPYAVLSDYFKNVGNLDEARDWLEKGLAAVPGAEPLRKRQTELTAARASRAANTSPKTPAETEPAEAGEQPSRP